MYIRLGVNYWWVLVDGAATLFDYFEIDGQGNADLMADGRLTGIMFSDSDFLKAWERFVNE